MATQLEIPLMAAIKPSQQTERLEIVQRAARHLLDVVSRKPGGFGTMDIFPEGIGTPKYNTSEYTWRGQIAWCWAKAGWLEQKISGQGTQKHWVYKLLSKGRRPIEKIAEDPVAASFYISIKRPTTSGADYPASWYQAPQTRGLDEEELLPKLASRERSQEEEHDRGARADSDFVDLFPIKKRLPDQEPEGMPEDVAPAAGMEGLVASFLEQNFKALEVMISTLGEIKREVKAQSDLVLEAAQKLEGSASRDDVAQAAAEIASVLAKRREEPSVLLGVEALFTRHESLHQKLATELATIAERRKADDDSLADKIGKSVAESLRKSFEKDIAKASANSAGLAATTFHDLVVGSLKSEVGKLKEEVLAALALAKKPRGKAEGLEDKLDVLEERASGIEAMLSDISEGADRIGENLISVSVELKRQTQSVSDSHARALDTASELVSASRTIVKEMLDLGMERASAGGASFSVVRQKALGAIERLNDAEDRVNQRSLPTGAALLRPTGGASALSGGILPLGAGVDVSEEEDDEDDES